jgi:hypothetical protein
MGHRYVINWSQGRASDGMGGQGLSGYKDNTWISKLIWQWYHLLIFEANDEEVWEPGMTSLLNMLNWAVWGPLVLFLFIYLVLGITLRAFTHVKQLLYHWATAPPGPIFFSHFHLSGKIQQMVCMGIELTKETWAGDWDLAVISKRCWLKSWEQKR